MVSCNVAYSAPLRTRRERAERLRQEKRDFFARYTEPARPVLNDILDKYIEYGTAEFRISDILRLPPISGRGTALEIAALSTVRSSCAARSAKCRRPWATASHGIGFYVEITQGDRPEAIHEDG